MDYNDNLDSIFDEVEDVNQTIEDVNLDTSDNFDDIFSEEDEVKSDDKSSNKSIMDKYLESKGFVGSKIKVVGDNDEESEVLFHELSEEEQLDVLNSLSTSNTDYDENSIA